MDQYPEETTQTVSFDYKTEGTKVSGISASLPQLTAFFPFASDVLHHGCHVIKFATASRLLSAVQQLKNITCLPEVEGARLYQQKIEALDTSMLACPPHVSATILKFKLIMRYAAERSVEVRWAPCSHFCIEHHIRCSISSMAKME